MFRPGRPSKKRDGIEHSGPSEAAAVDQLIHVHPTGEVSSQFIRPASPPPQLPTDLEDEYASFQFGADCGDDDTAFERGEGLGLFLDRESGKGDDGEGDSGEGEAGLGKRKRFRSVRNCSYCLYGSLISCIVFQDHPMEDWKPWTSLFADEGFRRHGLGSATLDPRCSTSDISLHPTKFWLPDTIRREPIKADQDFCAELYRCKTCGDLVECQVCCVRRHERIPTHVVQVCVNNSSCIMPLTLGIQVWKDGSWERCSLYQMGLVYQLGHSGGPCRWPDPTPRLITIMAGLTIQTVSCRFCKCAASDRCHPWQQLLRCGWYPATTHIPQTCASVELLDFYRRLKVMATVNVRDFVSVLEDLTDPYSSAETPDRYKAFLRMSRQWNFLKRVRRSGVLYDTGLDDAPDGAVAVECWACPRLNVNLPPNWDSVDSAFS